MRPGVKSQLTAGGIPQGTSPPPPPSPPPPLVENHTFPSSHTCQGFMLMWLSLFRDAPWLRKSSFELMCLCAGTLEGALLLGS